MDAMTLWPALIKRLRFLASLKQCELAQQLGVDQAMVSRWERGVYVPDIPLQRVLRDRLRVLQPTISAEYIEASPALPASIISALSASRRGRKLRQAFMT